MRILRIARNLVLALLQPLGQERPKTPVRWLCLKTFSYFARVESQFLTPSDYDRLNMAVELGICLNRYFDGKCALRADVYRRLRRGLPSQATREYVTSIKTLESNKLRLVEWECVYQYRREVLRVSLHYLSTLVGLRRRNCLLSLCSLIQLADDVLDQRLDQRLGLPTFVRRDGPKPEVLAFLFWTELRERTESSELPILWSGWLVYLLCRALIGLRRLV